MNTLIGNILVLMVSIMVKGRIENDMFFNYRSFSDYIQNESSITKDNGHWKKVIGLGNGWFIDVSSPIPSWFHFS